MGKTISTIISTLIVNKNLYVRLMDKEKKKYSFFFFNLTTWTRDTRVLSTYVVIELTYQEAYN